MEKKKIGSGIHFGVGGLLVLALSACNSGGDQPLEQVQGSDLTGSPSAPSMPETSPVTPTPSATVSSAPSPRVSSSPTPRPTVTRTPVPTPTSTPTVTPTPTASPTGGQLYIGPAEVEKYVLKFVDDAKMQGVDVLPKMRSPQLTIQIASLDNYGSSTIGLCESGTSMKRVTFDPDFWNAVSETQRELLAHHELGHCVLRRAHRSETLSTGAYASIMYPIIMNSATYTANYAYYQNELFTWTAQALEDLNAVAGDTIHICNHESLF